MEESGDCTLFVGDLSREVTREDLCDLFQMVGKVSEVVLKCSKVTGQPMGYGFVRMSTKQGAESALMTLTGVNLKGRCIRVGRAERNCRLIVKNLNQTARLDELLSLFLPYGNMHHQDTGQEVIVNGYSARILHFIRRQDAERAKRDMHLKLFHGRPMHVEWYRHTPGSELSGVTEHDITHRPEHVVSIHVRFMSMEEGIKVDEHLLYHTFKKFGEVTKVSIKALVPDKDSNAYKGYAFVHFPSTLDGCRCALEAAGSMDGSMYNCVHFFCKPSQNFQRAYKELLKHHSCDKSTKRYPHFPQYTTSRYQHLSHAHLSQTAKQDRPYEAQSISDWSGDYHPVPDYESVDGIYWQERCTHMFVPEQYSQNGHSSLGYDEVLYMEAIGLSPSARYERDSFYAENKNRRELLPTSGFPNDEYSSDSGHLQLHPNSDLEESTVSPKNSSDALQQSVAVGSRVDRCRQSSSSMIPFDETFPSTGVNSIKASTLFSPTSIPHVHRISPHSDTYPQRRRNCDLESGGHCPASSNQHCPSEQNSIHRNEYIDGNSFAHSSRLW
eukprot:CAMPEP_0185032148 /NCGR_PEP_ID=MMETSP1103-20130426/20042_1 /TAXON_ID=36769 /ORGANISM="Paraphysomonas bandaiensis, Strain Caron Lab Isolate" /LENGTH=553 /DNA_ID=CAMNT_0027567935 /DNA_START=37 /DNA_END=1695 /DNA_ORIENTATION=-